MSGTPLSKILFNKHDKDKSGSITRNEFKDLCYEMGHYLNDTELDHAIKVWAVILR